MNRVLGEQTGNPQRHHRCRVTDVVDGIGEQRDAARQHDEVLDRNPHFHLHALQTSNMAAIKACEDTPGVFSGLRSGRVADGSRTTPRVSFALLRVGVANGKDARKTRRSRRPGRGWSLEPGRQM